MTTAAFTSVTAVSVFRQISMRYCGFFRIFCAVFRPPLRPPHSSSKSGESVYGPFIPGSVSLSV